MKLQRLLIALTIFNLGLLVFLLAQIEVRFLGERTYRGHGGTAARDPLH
jgi:hypothetical protein